MIKNRNIGISAFSHIGASLKILRTVVHGLGIQRQCNQTLQSIITTFYNSLVNLRKHPMNVNVLVLVSLSVILLIIIISTFNLYMYKYCLHRKHWIDKLI